MESLDARPRNRPSNGVFMKLMCFQHKLHSRLGSWYCSKLQYPCSSCTDIVKIGVFIKARCQLMYYGGKPMSPHSNLLVHESTLWLRRTRDSSNQFIWMS
eukprot:3418637-Amphidinium_carterae.1